MEHSDGAKRLKLSDGTDEDRLSALPDDILIHVLAKLRGGTAVAARTSVLSRRWRGLWALLPELHFPVGTEPHRIRSALTAHEAPTIHSLVVKLRDAAPESVGTWLPVAAPRLSGDLVITHYRVKEAVQRGAVELPCIERATAIWLNLDDFGLTLPPSGVFDRLTDLRLITVNLHGPCRLGDIVSSPRCPSLRKLFLCDVVGLGDFLVHSESLIEIVMENVLLHRSGGGIVNICSGSLFQIELKSLIYLQQLTIVAPELRVLKGRSFVVFDANPSKPVAKISAPQLMSLDWNYYRGPRSIQFDKMAHLFWLYAGRFLVYEYDDEDFPHNHIGLLQCFEFIVCLYLTLVYSKNIANHQYLMEDMPRLPHIRFLSLNVEANGHSFGASLFHVLRMCAGVRKLDLAFYVTTEQLEEQTECPSGCICDQPPYWKTEGLQLSCLENIEISGWRGTENEVAFVERLFSWATTALKEMTVTFHQSITESIAKDLCQTLLSFSRPETCSMKFQIYQGSSILLLKEQTYSSLSAPRNCTQDNPDQILPHDQAHRNKSNRQASTLTSPVYV